MLLLKKPVEETQKGVKGLTTATQKNTLELSDAGALSQEPLESTQTILECTGDKGTFNLTASSRRLFCSISLSKIKTRLTYSLS